MAKAPKPGKARKDKGSADRPGAGGGRSVVWLSGLACGVLAAVAPGVVLLAAGLLLPGLVALWLEREAGRPRTRSMMTFGLAGCVQPVITLWNAGQSLDAAWSMAFDPAVLLIAWSAAAAGWLMAELAPLGVRAFMEAGAVAQTAHLRLARARLVEAWGLENSPDAQAGE